MGLRDRLAAAVRRLLWGEERPCPYCLGRAQRLPDGAEYRWVCTECGMPFVPQAVDGGDAS